VHGLWYFECNEISNLISSATFELKLKWLYEIPVSAYIQSEILKTRPKVANYEVLHFVAYFNNRCPKWIACSGESFLLCCDRILVLALYSYKSKKSVLKTITWVSHRILNLKSVKLAVILSSDLSKSIELWQIINLKFGEKLRYKFKCKRSVFLGNPNRIFLFCKVSWLYHT
jgi:hypothetical protein